MLNKLKNLFTKSKPETNDEEYLQRINNEVKFYKDCHQVHELPDIFHYWSNKYLLPKHKPFGFISPDDFFVKYSLKTCKNNQDKKQINILSVGSGNGELEIKIAETLFNEGIKNFSVECMDINENMLKRTLELAQNKKIDQHVEINQADFNQWTPNKKYDLIIANQSLHHVMGLEHLFDSIHDSLNEKGLFITSDMIGRNGHMRWPEALELLNEFWHELSDSYKYNQLLKRHEETYINHDCSTEGFEGIRAQDVLPLLVERFNFELFVPFANIILVLIDRPFGHNFDSKNQSDLDFIDRVHQADEDAIMNGIIKPTQMYAVMTKAEVKNPQLLHPKLTPEFCIRKTN